MSAGRDNHRWLRLWKAKDIAFHQLEVNRFLKMFWARALEPKEHRVFVPLCGKSRDMIWLAQQGHQVVGVELSTLAAEAFFRESGLVARKTRVGAFVQFKSKQISILCGDYFLLTKEVLGAVDSVYDCTALSALSEAVRPQYVAQLKKVLAPATNILLLTIEDTLRSSGRPFPAPIEPEVAALYGPQSDIRLTHHEWMEPGDKLCSEDQTMQSAYYVYEIELR